MLVTTALDRGVPDDFNTSAPGRAVATHRRALEILASEAAIVCPDSDWYEDFAASLLAVADQSVRSLWLTALPLLRTVLHPAAPQSRLEDIYDTASLTRAWRSIASLAVVDPTRSEFLGVPVGEPSVVDVESDVEIVRYDALDLANRLSQARALRQTDIAIGSTRDDVWRDRIEVFARTSRSVAILDRYVGKNLVEARASGIGWLTRRIAAAGPVELTIVTGTDTDCSVTDIRAAADRQLRPECTGLRSVQIVIAPGHAFRAAHTRHMRFDQSATLVIEPGCDAFNEPRVSRSFPIIRTESRAALDRETAVRSMKVARHEVYLVP